MDYLDADFTKVVHYGGRFGYEVIHKFGRNSEIDTTSDPEDVWNAGGTMDWETVAAAVSVTSGSGDDDGSPLGTGAGELTIVGLDGSFAEQTEAITLNGASAVTTGATFLRVNRAFVSQVGTYHGSNAGAITATINGNNTFVIGAGDGQTLLARYTVPAGKVAYISSATIGVNATKSADLVLYQCQNAEVVASPFTGAKRAILVFDGVVGEFLFAPKVPLGPFMAKTDLWWTVAAVAANDTSVSVDFEILQATA